MSDDSKNETDVEAVERIESEKFAKALEYCIRETQRDLRAFIERAK